MSAAWIASDVRAVGISHRTLGSAGARAVATCESLPDALTLLANSAYGREIRAGQSLESAQHAVAMTALWNTRVLAGWVPTVGIPMLRALVGWYEISNIEEQIRGGFEPPSEPFFRLGGLALGWAKLAPAANVNDLCDRLAMTRWGRPDDTSSRTIGLGLRATLLRRSLAALPERRDWFEAAAAIWLARDRLRGASPLPSRPAQAFAASLGEDAVSAATLSDFVTRLTDSARWPFQPETVDVTAEDLSRAESRWWSRVETDGRAQLRTGNFDSSPVVGAAAVIAADAWRVRAALAAAAHGGQGLEEFDALA